MNPRSTEEFKDLYLKHYGVRLTSDQALELGTRLVELFRVISRPPRFDKRKVTT